VGWKIEDKYIPGVPDFLVKSPLGHVSVVELKWSSLKRGVKFEASREQWAHLRQWDDRAFLLVASENAGIIVLAPAKLLFYTNQNIPVKTVLSRRPGYGVCPYDKASLKKMLRHHLL
jgi:hypothetical protein